jgi:ribonuclease BN (tRNA processing enzyme)
MSHQVGRDPSPPAAGTAAGRFLEITVVGSAPSAPQPDGQGSGLLVRAGPDKLLLDCGTGVMSHLLRVTDPRTLTAVVVTHFHADHYLDLVSLRYHLPWAGVDGRRIPVFLPPGGTARLAALAEVISEAPDFFARALDIHEYDPDATPRIGAMTLSFAPSRHYIPGWAIAVAVDGGPRLFYTGDTGPSAPVTAAARGADLLVVEATLADVREDVAERGHLTTEEALDMASEAGVRRVLLTHLPSERRAAIRALADRRAATPGPGRVARRRLRVHVGRPGLRLTIRPAPPVDPR